MFSQSAPPHELMTDAQQNQLAMRLVADIEAFLKANGKSDRAALGLLLSFVWGWARRCKYTTQELVNRAAMAFDACDRVDEQRQRGNRPSGANGTRH